MKIQPIFDVNLKKYISADIFFDNETFQLIKKYNWEIVDELFENYKFKHIIINLNNLMMEDCKDIIKDINKKVQVKTRKEKIYFKFSDKNELYCLKDLIKKKNHTKYVKLDNELVNNIVNNDETQEFVQRFIQILHASGLEVLADNVNDRYQANLLIQMGIDKIRGLYYSRPLTMNELKNWIIFNN